MEIHLTSQKLVILLLHASTAVSSIYILFKLNKVVEPFIRECFIGARFMAKCALFTLIWNIMMIFGWTFLVNGYPISPAGYLLWPSLCVLIGFIQYLGYESLMEHTKLTNVQQK